MDWLRPHAWLVLLAAGLLEIAWAMGLKYSAEFTHFWTALATIVGMLASVGLLGIAARWLPIGTAYAVWTGIGSLGVVTLGIILFGESADVARLVCIGLIVVGVVGLRFVNPG